MSNLQTAPLPQIGLAFADQDPLILLAMCVWGESRGQNMQAKIGVASVVKNRVACQGKYGEGFKGVILKPWQFSSFNADDVNSAKLLEPTKHDKPEVWEECYTAAYLVYTGSVAGKDPTRNAVFYFSHPLTEPPKKRDGSCAWGNVEPTVVIDGLHFYREA